MTTTQAEPAAPPTSAGPRHRRGRGAGRLPELRAALPAALDAVEAELAEPIRVISSRIWATVAAIAVAMATAGAWGFVGTWPQHVSTSAVVVHGAGPQQARATAQGSVLEIDTAVGRPVAAGQQVAIVQQADGARSLVLAPTDGTVSALLSAPGTAALPGTPIVSVDATSAAPTAQLVVTDAASVQRLAPGQRVLLDVDNAPVTGQVAAAAPVKTTAAAVATALTVDLPGGDTPVWLVTVTLDSGQRVAGPSVAKAVVQLPNIRVYKLLTGTQ